MKMDQEFWEHAEELLEVLKSTGRADSSKFTEIDGMRENLAFWKYKKQYGYGDHSSSGVFIRHGDYGEFVLALETDIRNKSFGSFDEPVQGDFVLGDKKEYHVKGDGNIVGDDHDDSTINQGGKGIWGWIKSVWSLIFGNKGA